MRLAMVVALIVLSSVVLAVRVLVACVMHRVRGRLLSLLVW